MTREEQKAKYREYLDRVLDEDSLTEGEIEEYHSLEDELLGNKRDMVSETEADARGNQGVEERVVYGTFPELGRGPFTPTVKTMKDAIPVSRFNDPSELTEEQLSGVYGGPNNPGYAAEYNRGDNIFRGNIGEFLSTPESQEAIDVDKAGRKK